MTSKNKKLINKYILLLAISYLLEIVMTQYLKYVSITDDFNSNEGIISGINFGLTILINISFAFIIEHDRKQSGFTAKYLTLATIVYRPLGVVAFLLYFLHSEKEETTSTIDLLSE